MPNFRLDASGRCFGHEFFQPFGCRLGEGRISALVAYEGPHQDGPRLLHYKNSWTVFQGPVRRSSRST